MPNAKILESKKAVVSALEEQLKNAQSGVLVDYSGITVAQDTALRNKMREAGVQYNVVKNTMVRRALDDAGLNELDDVLHGNTALAIGVDDPIVPIRTISDAIKELGPDTKFHIKAAFLEGKILSQEEIAQMATLSSKNDLIAQLLGVMQAPIVSLAAVIAAIVEKEGGDEAAPEAEAAPAAE
ncbi:MAG: 50S ribosomal protein L10 [Clostridiales bacterium]|nr:50S ribosomal protein L10 [Clostridiales bacterium]